MKPKANLIRTLLMTGKLALVLYVVAFGFEKLAQFTTSRSLSEKVTIAKVGHETGSAIVFPAVYMLECQAFSRDFETLGLASLVITGETVGSTEEARVVCRSDIRGEGVLHLLPQVGALRSTQGTNEVVVTLR